MVEFTRRRNLNRGFMKLDVWNEAIVLLKFVDDVMKMQKIDFKLKSQILGATQSISANIAEGYCRKSINEYLYFLNVALGSSGEVFTRIIGLRTLGTISETTFEEFDKMHYSIENKLLALIKSLQLKRNNSTWDDQIHEPVHSYSTIP